MAELNEPLTLASLVSLAVLGVLALRRLARVERFHMLLVIILTALLWLPVFYLFTLEWRTFSHGGCFTF